MDLLERTDAQLPRHPWERTRFEFFEGVLERTPGVQLRGILDAGAGDGYVAAELAERHPFASLTCWDVHYDAETLSELRAEAPPRVSFTAEPPVGTFDVILLLDVLEHVEDDHRFLRQLIHEHLASDGHLLISVPAWPALFSSHDVALRHFRRYTPEAAAEVLTACGLQIVRRGGLFHSLLLPRALSVLVERVRAHLGHAPEDTPSADDLAWHHGVLSARLVEAALRLDNRLSRRFARFGLEVPGLTWWALARRQA